MLGDTINRLEIKGYNIMNHIITGSIYKAHTWDDIRATGGDSLAADTLTITEFVSLEDARAAFDTLKNKFDTSTLERDVVYALFWLCDVDGFIINELKIDKGEN